MCLVTGPVQKGGRAVHARWHLAQSIFFVLSLSPTYVLHRDRPTPRRGKRPFPLCLVSSLAYELVSSRLDTHMYIYVYLVPLYTLAFSLTHFLRFLALQAPTSRHSPQLVPPSRRRSFIILPAQPSHSSWLLPLISRMMGSKL